MGGCSGGGGGAGGKELGDAFEHEVVRVCVCVKECVRCVFACVCVFRCGQYLRLSVCVYVRA